MPSTQNGIPSGAENDGLRRRDALKIVASLAALPAGGHPAQGQASALVAALGDNQRAQAFDDGWRFHRGDLDPHNAARTAIGVNAAMAVRP